MSHVAFACRAEVVHEECTAAPRFLGAFVSVFSPSGRLCFERPVFFGWLHPCREVFGRLLLDGDRTELRLDIAD